MRSGIGGIGLLVMVFLIEFAPITLLVLLVTRKPLEWLEQWYEAHFQNNNKNN